MGTPTVEDRVLQRVAARILSAICEQDLVESSSVYPPERNPRANLRLRGKFRVTVHTHPKCMVLLGV